MSRVASLLLFAGVLAFSHATATPPGAAVGRILTFEERVEAQVAIERVYWNHRIWSGAPDRPKPPLEEVLGEAEIRSKVTDYLRKSHALEVSWNRPITPAQLQAELDRLTIRTRRPEMLTEIFDALGRDPYLIAECFVRPLLSDRFIRERYAYDDRFHGRTHQLAKRALAQAGSAEELRQIGSIHRTREWQVEDRGHESERGDDSGPQSLSVAEFEAHIRSLLPQFRETALAGLSSDPSNSGSQALRAGQVGVLQEDRERFYVRGILDRGSDHVSVVVAEWPKTPFDQWWAGERGAVEWTEHPSGDTYRLPEASGGSCVDYSWRPLDDSVPDARFDHTAVWTGTEMLIWGGQGWDSPQRGSRYTPATDTWTAITTTGAPSARWGHIAVWTGSRMIVWGGEGADGYFNDGGLYDPTTDTWESVSMTDAPSARIGHSGVWSGSEMIVWGGCAEPCSFDNRIATGGRYDPIGDSWSPTNVSLQTPDPRWEHTAVWTGEEMIVWGGQENYQSYVSDGGRYDPNSDSWIEIGISVQGRSGHTAVWTGTEMIAWGGSHSVANERTGIRYDPATGSWSPTSEIGVEARTFHTAVWTGNEMIVYGGTVEGAQIPGFRYRPDLDVWGEIDPLDVDQDARWRHSAIWTGSEMIVYGGSAGFILSTGGRYNPANRTWLPTSQGPAKPSARHKHTAIWTGAEMIVWGGFDGSGTHLSSGGRYDPTTDTWTPTRVDETTPLARRDHTAVWTGSEMIVWGGWYSSPANPVGLLNSGARYDPATDTWTETPFIEIWQRRYHTAIWTGEEMIVWGGLKGGRLQDGARFDPISNSWSLTSTGSGVPEERYHHSAVWTGSEMIVWGGFGHWPLNSGSRYDPLTDSWVPIVVGPSTPEIRLRHNAIWTGSEMLVWGGEGDDYEVNSGGRYDPTTDSWAPTSTAPGVPEARQKATAVWSGTEMIIWGGENVAGAELDTGGRYDPADDTWTPTVVSGQTPTPRLEHTATWTGTEMIIWGGAPLDSSASAYCGVCTQFTWYFDGDDDGFGDEANATEACEVPAGFVALGGDCDDGNPATFPGAIEINDGQDNQCPGDHGYGILDELTGDTGFLGLDSKDDFSWSPQEGATLYEVVRSPVPDFTSDCVLIQVVDTGWADMQTPPVGGTYYYLVRPVAPNMGSWGQAPVGERQVACSPNLLRNGGLEDWNSAMSPTDWSRTLSAGDVSRGRNDVYAGRYCAELSRTADLGPLEIFQVNFGFEPQSSYRLALHAKGSQPVLDGIAVVVHNTTRDRFLSADGGWRSGWARAIGVDAAAGWRRYEIVFTMDPMASTEDAVTLILGHDGTGQPGTSLCYDDISLTLLPAP